MMRIEDKRYKVDQTGFWRANGEYINAGGSNRSVKGQRRQGGYREVEG